MRLQEAGWLWSGGTRLDVPGSQFVKLRHRDQKVRCHVGVCVVLHVRGVVCCFTVKLRHRDQKVTYVCALYVVLWY